MGNRESVAMWNLYAGENGLAIQFNRESLQNRVKLQSKKNILPPDTKRLIAGKVRYHDFREVSQNEKDHLLKYLSFRKDKSFEHEKEYRFVLNLNKPCPNQERFDYYLGDLKSLGLKVITSPRMSDEHFFLVEKTIKEIDPSSPLHQSELTPWFKFFEEEKRQL